MKIKVKNEMEKIKAKLNHQELVLIEEALYELRNKLVGSGKGDEYDKLNQRLFDKYEFESNNDLIIKLTEMISEIEKITDKIDVW